MSDEQPPDETPEDDNDDDTPDEDDTSDGEDSIADIERIEEVLDTRPELTVLVLFRDQLQKLRIAEGNRVVAAQKLGEESRAETHRYYAARLQELEDEITHTVVVEVRNHPAWPWLHQIRGVAETSAGVVLGYIDIERAPTVSALWKYAGYGVIQQPCPNCEGDPERALKCEVCHGVGTVGSRDRLMKGVPSTYNRRLKTMMWRLTDLQVKLRGPFRTEYDNAKNLYITTRGPETKYKDPRTQQPWTKAHCEAAARRKASKLFLSMLWEVWREALGLPVRPAYIGEHAEGHTMLDPWEYVGAVRQTGAA